MSDLERCPSCGSTPFGIVTTGPTEHHMAPCGCKVAGHTLGGESEK